MEFPELNFHFDTRISRGPFCIRHYICLDFLSAIVTRRPD